MAKDSQLKINIVGDASQIRKVFGQAEESAGKFGKAIGGVASAAGGFLAANVIMKGFDAAVGGAAQAVFGLNNEYEAAQTRIMAFTKDQAVTADILQKVRDEANKTPFAFNEMANATAALIPTAKMANVSWEELLKTGEILAASNPMEGLEGASFALKEAVSGDFTSIIERFNLSRQTINRLKDEGVPALEIVRRAMEEQGLDASLVAGMAQTAAGRWATFQDTIDNLKMSLTKPIFEGLKTGLTALQGVLDANSERLTRFAETVGNAFGGALQAGISFVANTALPTMQTLGDYLGFTAQSGDYLNDSLSDLPAPLRGVAEAMGKAVATARDFVDSLALALDLDPGAYAENWQGLGNELRDIFQRTLPWVQEFLSALGSTVVQSFMLDLRILTAAFRPLMAAFRFAAELLGHFSGVAGESQQSAMLAAAGVGTLVQGFIALQVVSTVNGMLQNTIKAYRDLSKAANTTALAISKATDAIHNSLFVMNPGPSLIDRIKERLYVLNGEMGTTESRANNAAAAVSNLIARIQALTSKVVDVTARVTLQGAEALDTLTSKTLDIRANVQVPEMTMPDVSGLGMKVAQGLATGIGAALIPLLSAVSFPVVALVGAAAAIVGGIVLAIKDPKLAGQIAGGIAAVLASAVTLAVGSVAFVAATLGQGLISMVSAAIDFVGSAVGIIGSALGQILSEGIRTALAIATQIFVTWPLQIISTITSTLGPPIAALLHDIISGNWRAVIQDGLAVLTALFVELPGKLLGVITSGLANIGAQFSGFFRQVASITSGAFSDLRAAWDGFTSRVSAIVFGMISGILSAVGGWVGQFTAGFQSGFSSVLSAIDSFTGNAITQFWSLVGEVRGVFDVAKGWLDTTWEGIKTKASDSWIWMRTTFENGKDALKAALLWPFERARDAIGGIMEGFKRNLAVPWNAAADGINGFIVNAALAVNWVAKQLTGSGLNIDWGGLPKIPRFARGGVHQGGLMIAGEEGEELLVAPRGTRVFSHKDTVDLFKTLNDRPPEGVPLGPNGPLGLGAGPLDGVVSAVKGMASSAAESVRKVLDKGVGWLVQTALGGLGLDTGGGALGGIGSGIFSKVTDLAKETITKLFETVKKALPDTVPNGNAILNMAYQTPGMYLWCEKFIGDVFARLGLPYTRAASAAQHARMQPLNPGTGPAGAVVFLPWDTYGHVAFSLGDGRIYGTANTPSGKGVMNAWAGAGWTAHPAANGLHATGGPVLSLLNEANPAEGEIAAPVPMLRRIVSEEAGGDVIEGGMTAALNELYKPLGKAGQAFADVKDTILSGNKALDFLTDTSKEGATQVQGSIVTLADSNTTNLLAAKQSIDTGAAGTAAGLSQVDSSVLGVGGAVDGVGDSIDAMASDNRTVFQQIVDILRAAVTGSAPWHVITDGGAGPGGPATDVNTGGGGGNVVGGGLTPGMGNLINPPPSSGNGDVITGGLTPGMGNLLADDVTVNGDVILGPGPVGGTTYNPDVILGPLPKFARGGVFDRPTLGIFGEGRDREIAEPEPLLRRIVREETRLGAGITVNITGPITFTGPQDVDRFGTDVAVSIRAALRRQGRA